MKNDLDHFLTRIFFWIHFIFKWLFDNYNIDCLNEERISQWWKCGLVCRAEYRDGEQTGGCQGLGVRVCLYTVWPDSLVVGAEVSVLMQW